MRYEAKVQKIQRAHGEQWYIGIPAQLAKAIELQKSETVEWIVEDGSTLVLKRHNTPDQGSKKN